MTDTRKDPRAPVALKVRFKSKSVDEFAEQFSQDISRGGLFIKSRDPMPIGTMLKFELQLSDETKIIAGVGRVVWRRDAMESVGDEAPSGMGIKFIKMDPESRALVDRVVDGRDPNNFARFEHGANPENEPAPKPAATFFPSGPSAPQPAPEDRTQVRHARELLAAAFQEGGARDAHARTEQNAKETRERLAKMSETLASPSAQRGRRNSFPPTAAALRDEDEVIEVPIASDENEEPTVIHARRDPTLSYSQKSDRESEFGPTPVRKDMPDFVGRVPTSIGRASVPPIGRASVPPVAASLRSQEMEIDDDDEVVEPLALRQNLEREASGLHGRNSGFVDGQPSTPPLTAPLGARLSLPVNGPVGIGANFPTKTPDIGQAPSKLVPITLALVLVSLAIGLGVWITHQRAQQRAHNIETPAVQNETAVNTQTPTPALLAQENTEPHPTPDPIEPMPTAGIPISSIPSGAQIYVGNALRGTTPLTLSLPIGIATDIEVRAEGFVTARQSIDATLDHPPLNITLTSLPWMVAVNSVPPGASVRIGGKTGTTPVSLEPPHTTRPTPWSVLISMPGYLPQRVVVNPEAYIPGTEARVASVNVVLEPVRRASENVGVSNDTRHEPPPRSNVPHLGEPERTPEGNAQEEPRMQEPREEMPPTPAPPPSAAPPNNVTDTF